MPLNRTFARKLHHLGLGKAFQTHRFSSSPLSPEISSIYGTKDVHKPSDYGKIKVQLLAD